MLWPAPPARLTLSTAETHVFSLDLNLPAQRIRELECLLSPDELSRSARFKFERHRRRYVAGRGQLRLILGRYLKAEASSLSFSYGKHGKPALDEDEGTDNVQFNLSRSGEIGLVALHLAGELGVDIEHLRAVPDALLIAKRIFSAEEYRAMDALPAAEQNAAFLGYWTRKEAVVKSIGMGLSLPTESFTLCAKPDEDAETVEIPQLGISRSVRRLPQPEGSYIAALATAERPAALSCWAWS